MTSRAGRHGRAERPAASAPPPTSRASFDDPLIFNVAGLLQQPAGTVRDLELHDIAVEPGDGIRVVRPVDGRFRLTRTNRGLRIAGQLTTALAGECRRCLRPVEMPLELTIDEEVRPSIDLHSGQPTPLEEGEDLETNRLTDHHELDLRPLIQEAIVLAEPIAPLCEPDCPGLCAECGIRMTPGHEHPVDDIDPRLEALRAFKVDASDETG